MTRSYKHIRRDNARQYPASQLLNVSQMARAGCRQASPPSYLKESFSLVR
jgi:hypothetical protein